MVVVGIIIILVSLTAPAVGPMLASNDESQAASTVSGLLTAAQTSAQATGLPVAIRFERAYKVDDRGMMVDVQGRLTTNSAFSGPVWLDYQRARIVNFATTKQVVFRWTPQSKVYSLPRNFWVAPAAAVSPGATKAFTANSLLAGVDYPAGTRYQPVDGTHVKPPYAFDLLDTFYVVIGADGELTRFPASDNGYFDQTQPYIVGTDTRTPYVGHPDESARGLLVYDRKKWDSLPANDNGARLDFLRTTGRVLFINRATAAVVEGAQP